MDFRLELTVWFVPSLVGNAVAVGLGLSSALPDQTINSLTGILHRRVPWPDVPHPHVALVADPPPRAGHRLHGLYRGSGRGRCCCITWHSGGLGAEVWDRGASTLVSLFSVALEFRGDAVLFFQGGFLHDVTGSGLGVCSKDYVINGLMGADRLGAMGFLRTAASTRVSWQNRHHYIPFGMLLGVNYVAAER